MSDTLVIVDSFRECAMELVWAQPTAIERRCYALLQAAAILYGSPEGALTIPQCVEDAEKLLAEIERREQDKAPHDSA